MSEPLTPESERLCWLVNDLAGLDGPIFRNKLVAIEAAAARRALIYRDPDCNHYCENGHYDGDDMLMNELNGYYWGYQDGSEGRPYGSWGMPTQDTDSGEDAPEDV